MNTYDKMNSISLSSRDELFNKLNNSHISDREYDHANEVWGHCIQMQNIQRLP
jgi:hypothetical protein